MMLFYKINAVILPHALCLKHELKKLCFRQTLTSNILIETSAKSNNAKLATQNNNCIMHAHKRVTRSVTINRRRQQMIEKEAIRRPVRGLRIRDW